MDVEGGGSGVKEHEVFFDLTNAADGGLKHPLDVYTLLGVHHLVVTFLQLPVNVYVLDVELSEMLENIIVEPSLNYLHTCLVFLCGYVFYFDLEKCVINYEISFPLPMCRPLV